MAKKIANKHAKRISDLLALFRGKQYMGDRLHDQSVKENDITKMRVFAIASYASKVEALEHLVCLYEEFGIEHIDMELVQGNIEWYKAQKLRHEEIIGDAA